MYLYINLFVHSFIFHRFNIFKTHFALTHPSAHIFRSFRRSKNKGKRKNPQIKTKKTRPLMENMLLFTTNGFRSF